MMLPQGLTHRIVGIVIGVGVLAWLGYGSYATWQGENGLDFGDAPDGTIAYTVGDREIPGRFPSLTASNGARATEVSQVWLGNTADKEPDSRQVNNDRFDDGVALRMESTKPSRAHFAVHVKEPGKTTGTAYLNLWIDGNRDGTWGGSGASAAEWAVRNVAVDLSAQSQALDVYTVPFTAGTEIKDVWYRATVSLGQRLEQEDGSGEFQSGEVEDDGPPIHGKEKNFFAVCDPDPLMLKHGGGGFINMVATPHSEPVQFYGAKKGTNLKDKTREIKDSGVRSLYYKSTQVDGPKRLVIDQVDVQYRFTGWSKKFTNSCEVWIQHDTKGGGGPPPGGDGDGDQDKDKDKGKRNENVTYSKEGDHPPATPSFTGQYETGTEGGLFYINLMVTPTNLAGTSFTGMEIDLHDQRPAFPDVANCSANANLDGWGASNWRLSQKGRIHRWFGATPMRQNIKSIMTLYFNKPFTPPATINVRVLDKNGNPTNVRLTR